MKTIQYLLIGLLVSFGGVAVASAQYYSSYNQNTNQYYQNTQATNTVYTQGCYTYQYNPYTGATVIIGQTCNSTYTAYTYTQPTYTYTQPTYTYQQTSPYYTYQYNQGSWSPSYGSGYHGYHNNYSNNNITMGGCIYINGYQACY